MLASSYGPFVAKLQYIFISARVDGSSQVVNTSDLYGLPELLPVGHIVDKLTTTYVGLLLAYKPRFNSTGQVSSTITLVWNILCTELPGDFRCLLTQ